MKICAKSDFYIFIPSDVQPLDLKFAPLVNLLHRNDSAKLEVSIAILFPENRRYKIDVGDGRGATLNVPHSRKGTGCNDVDVSSTGRTCLDNHLYVSCHRKRFPCHCKVCLVLSILY